VAVSFREGNLEALTDALDRGEIELGLMCSPHETPRRFERTPLYQEDYVLAIGDDHRFHGRDQVPVAELDREHYCERIFCEFSSHIERLLDERGVQLRTVQQSAREDWIQAFVRANVGVAFMPESLAQAAGLAGVRLLDLPIVREVALLRVAERPLSAAQQAVAAALRAHPWPRVPAAAPPAEAGP
jgi:DNA-binding transcriptional LysR family regulator